MKIKERRPLAADFKNGDWEVAAPWLRVGGRFTVSVNSPVCPWVTC
jgi:hypothetical protein